MIDLVEVKDSLTLVQQDGAGVCGRECQTITRACEEVRTCACVRVCVCIPVWSTLQYSWNAYV